jgi:hypothetical protein
MLNKLRNRGAAPARILRAMRAFEKEKDNVPTNYDSAKDNDTAEHYEEGGRAIF